jgi:ribose transport system ATP-binding protein
MLLYDPTRGVDVGTKREIYDIIQAHARTGGGVLWYSTDVLELVNVCDRILILYHGQAIAETRGDQATSDQVLSAMLGPQEVHDQ